MVPVFENACELDVKVIDAKSEDMVRKDPLTNIRNNNALSMTPLTCLADHTLLASIVYCRQVLLYLMFSGYISFPVWLDTGELQLFSTLYLLVV